MTIQEIIANLQKQNPHLHIENLHTDGSEIGYLRVSLENPGTMTSDQGVHEAQEVLLKRAEQTGHSREDAEGIARAAAYMDAHLSENTRQEELAKIAHMSPAKFKYTFSDLMKCSFREYKTVLRLKCACTLLARTNCTMEEIAGEIGYKRAATFTSFFREQMRMSPQEYRIRKQK